MRWVACLAIATMSVSGCATVRMGRPPSAEEIAVIDDAIPQGRALVIEPPLVLARQPGAGGCEGAACERVVPLERCAAGACDHVERGVREVPHLIVSADEKWITFQTKSGARVPVPLSLVSGVKVTRSDRAGGAAIGVAVGVGADLAAAGVLLFLSHLTFPDASDQPRTGCTDTCAAVLAVGALIPPIIGGLVGRAIGAPRRYVFSNDAHAAMPIDRSGEAP